MRAISLFSGCGGLDLGAHAAGFEPIVFCEIDKHAAANLRYNWPNVPIHDDVRTLHGRAYGRYNDLVHGGAPCQDLSLAGARKGFTGGQRSVLVYEQLRIWEESGAPYLLWENVPGALSSHGGKDFASLLSSIVGATVPVPAGGWRSGGVAAGRDAVAAWRLLDLESFGVPQLRPRIVVIASRPGGADPAEVLALGDDGVNSPAPRFAEREKARDRLSRRHTLDSGEQTGFFANTEADEAIGVPNETEAPEPVAPTSLVGAYRAEGTQTACVFGPGGIRMMMPVERERIAGLPDDWTRYGRREDGTVFELSDQQRYRLTGNLVGVEWGEWVCTRLAQAHRALGQ